MTARELKRWLNLVPDDAQVEIYLTTYWFPITPTRRKRATQQQQRTYQARASVKAIEAKLKQKKEVV